MKIFSRDQIESLPHIFKINLINSCSGYKSANLIATTDRQTANVAVFSSVTHMGSSPPLLGFFLRPTTVPRNTFENIEKTGVYSINHISYPQIEDGHHTSAKYPKEVSEFDVTSLESEFRPGFDAPFVKGSPVQMAMKFVNAYPIKENQTTLIVGSVEALFVAEHLIDDDGFIDLTKGEVATINGLDGYALPKTNRRLGYQRPKSEYSNSPKT